MFIFGGISIGVAVTVFAGRTRGEFHRPRADLLLGLQPAAPASTTELAGELASLFDLELIGLFIDDVALRHWAAMPAARAISALGAAWNSLEFAHGPGEADYAAESAGRRFAVASERLERRRFEIVRGTAAQALAS